MGNVASLQAEALAAIAAAPDRPSLTNLEKQYLGKDSALSALLKSLAGLSPDEKKTLGGAVNLAKKEIEKAYTERLQVLTQQELAQQLSAEKIDVTLPGQEHTSGVLHPLTQLQYQIEDTFSRLGFTIWDGPEVDTEYNNFNALNIPADHPARDMQDTFWLDGKRVLRTQTSNMQNRILSTASLPIKAIVPGRVFRCERTDASHDSMFYQIEGIMVDHDISIAHLNYVIEVMLSDIFGRPVQTRLRPGYFPFVEPGMELDFRCMICGGTGCPVCKHQGWVEFMGCGLIHPQVLREAQLDPDEISGFAFGFGLTRLAMMKYGINDIRLLSGGDLRFLTQFAA